MRRLELKVNPETTSTAMPSEPATAEPLAAGQRASFDRDGYLIIRGALSPGEVAAARGALDRVYATAAEPGGAGLGGGLARGIALAVAARVRGAPQQNQTKVH
jgi:hypothetical protein